MIRRVWLKLWRLTLGDRIERVQRRRFTMDFESATAEEWRVLARMGARAPQGIRRELRRADMLTAEEYADSLDHFRPVRKLRQRIDRMIGRVLNASPTPPHQRELRRIRRESRRRSANPDVMEVKSKWKNTESQSR